MHGELRIRNCLILAALVLLHAGCDKTQESKPAENENAQAPVLPFQVDGELLFVQVKEMPFAEYLHGLEKVTGSQIVTQGDVPPGKVSVRAEGVSLRKALSAALTDAPYDVQMHYANLQYQFPQQVVIHRVSAGVNAGTSAVETAGVATVATSPTESVAAPAAAPVGQASDPPLEEELVSVQERTAQLLATTEEERADTIFTLDSDDDDDLAVITALFQTDQLTDGDKVALLDTLETGERERVVSLVTPLLQDASTTVVLKAIDVLGSVGDETDVPVLRELAVSAANDDVKQNAADAADMLE